MPDLAGRLIVPTFAEPHTHLDRAFSSAITGWNRSGSLDEAVERFLGSIDRMTVESLAPGGRRALGLLYDAGVGHVRTHTAVGGPLGFRAWEAVEKAATLPGVEVRQVAMPIDSNLDAPEVAAWVREAAARPAARRLWAGPRRRPWRRRAWRSSSVPSATSACKDAPAGPAASHRSGGCATPTCASASVSTTSGTSWCRSGRPILCGRRG